MRTYLSILTGTTRLIIISLVVFLFSCGTKKEDLVSHIPREAGAVGIVDGASISTEIIADYISNFGFLEKNSSQIHVGNTGVDFSSDLYLFSEGKNIILIIPLNDAEKFSAFLRDSLIQMGEAKENDGYKLAGSPEKRLLAGWKKDFAVLAHYPSEASAPPLSALNRIMKLSKENSIHADTGFISFKNKKASVKLWWKTETVKGLGDPVSTFLTENFSGIQSFIRFESGKIILDQEFSLTDNSRKKFESNGYIFIPESSYPAPDSLPFNLTLNYQGAFLRSFLNDTLLTKAEGLGRLFELSLKNMENLLQGSIAMNYAGLSKRSNEVIRYEYDDNFNRVAVKSISYESFPEFNILLQNTRAADSVIAELIHKKVFGKEGNLYVSKEFFNNKIYLKKNDAYFMLSTNAALSDSRLASVKQNAAYPVELLLNPDALLKTDSLYILPEYYSKTAALVKRIKASIAYPEKGTLKTKLEVELKSGDKHPIIQILKSLPAETTNKPKPIL